MNAPPGWYRPASGSTRVPPPGRSATAMMWPVPACTATMAAAAGWPATALAAARCTPASMVVRTAVPRVKSHCLSTLTWWPAWFSAITSVPAAPASLRWYTFCRPDAPIVVPGR